MLILTNGTKCVEQITCLCVSSVNTGCMLKHGIDRYLLELSNSGESQW